jgi:polyferredoxin
MALGIPTRRVRIAVQAGVFALWVALILATHHPMDSWIARTIPVSLFLRFDPLVMTVVCGGMRVGVSILMLGFVTLGVSLLLGRVFCGWVCPLGSLFDFTGWILRRMRVRFHGPSPSWYRLKFYLLTAILVFALLGGVSPLMGLDPIVLITRVAATLFMPLWRVKADVNWAAGGSLGMHGALIDGLTLGLFLVILYGTTKLSRIWCRAVCPLGAYLGLLGRNSVLRRKTDGCVHCQICVTHCPTGAISAANPEVYVESECIKCFACSQECPVDANLFGLSNPLRAVTESQQPVSLGRREVLGTAAAAVVALPTLKVAGGDPQSAKRLIRPPMSREEPDFLSSCIRCGECMKACPTGVLKPAGLEHGLRALWSPVLTPEEGFCKPGCNACSQACPTDAILKYPVEKKTAYKAGTAVFENSRCISYTEEKFCSECVRACPTQAIEVVKDWEPEGANGRGSEKPAPAGRHPSRPIHVNFDRCIGCGACEFQCNQIVFGKPAMVTTSFGRAMPTTLKPSE